MVVRGRPTEVGEGYLAFDGTAVERWIAEVSPAEVWFRLIQGRLPGEGERRLWDAVLATLADHGDTPPSTQAARLVASTGVPLQASLAAGLLAFGNHHAGALEGVMEILQSGVARGLDPEALVDEALASGRRVPGFGHRLHRRDPRVAPLRCLAEERSLRRDHLAFFSRMEDLLGERKGIGGNVDGICGAVLSDLGFPFQAGRAFFLAGRLPGLTAHILRESSGGPFRRYALREVGEESSPLREGLGRAPGGGFRVSGRREAREIRRHREPQGERS
ncbi:MAG TPA: citrate/2-methylcitrate synthase [Synergistaceae bacterium]|nr:citrate/2-methylcitrate synthase [Synergistaceae bacterium]